MAARSVHEEHRVSTPLELLFDLTFVVAVSRVAAELASSIAHDRVATALPGYLMVFFAIWWAWMNFTWFASAFDTDDVPYRLLTLVQMAGVLVLAAGVHQAFSSADFTAVTVGYLVMRTALLLQWARAARQAPAHRRTALRFVLGVGLVQIGWVARLWLPGSLAMVSFLVLVTAELCVPPWAEHVEPTSWHPHHIAERYGLFTIIVLGECVLAATTAMQAGVENGGWAPRLVVVGAGSLVLLYALWWLYFLTPAGEGLSRRRELGFVWGYGHYGVFASLAALGAGLEVTVEAVGHRIEAADSLVGLAVAVPVAIYLVLLWALHAPLSRSSETPMSAAVPSLVAAVAVLSVSALVAAGLGIIWLVPLVAVPPSLLVAARCLRPYLPGVEV